MAPSLATALFVLLQAGKSYDDDSRICCGTRQSQVTTAELCLQDGRYIRIQQWPNSAPASHINISGRRLSQPMCPSHDDRGLGFYYYCNGCPPQSVKHSTPREHRCKGYGCRTSGQHSHAYSRKRRFREVGIQGYCTTRPGRYRCHSSRGVRSSSRSAVGDYDGEGYTSLGGHGRTGVASMSYSGRYDGLGRRRRKCLMAACSRVEEEGGNQEETRRSEGHGMGDVEGGEGGSQATHVHLPRPSKTRALNVVLTHTMADFDGLAAAVGLAKLWQHERPDDECCVCLPRGAHPVVKRFLALHKTLFPIKALRDINHDQVFRVGLVDAQRMDRLGAAASLLHNASEIVVLDHHVEQTTDINSTTTIIEKVGSVSTIITELLQQRCLKVEEAEATLLALGVHSDTGSLTFDSATPRDAAALAWLMEQGSSQQAIAEYGHAALSPEQQSTLTECINNLNRTSLNGATVATALVKLDAYVNGMAAVAQNVLDVTDSDVFMLGAHFPQKIGRDPTHMVLIGRARPRVNAVNLDALMSAYGGGGHRKAAAASFRIETVALRGGKAATPEAIMEDVVHRIFEEQIKELEVAEDMMTAPVVTCSPTDTVENVAKVLSTHQIRGMPVVEESGKVLGLISGKEVEKTMKLGRQHELVKGWMREQIVMADAGDPLHEVEEKFIKEDLGRLPVVKGGKLVGIITRADMLRQHCFYDGLHYHNRAYATPVDSPARRMLASLRKKLKKFDVD